MPFYVNRSHELATAGHITFHYPSPLSWSQMIGRQWEIADWIWALKEEKDHLAKNLKENGLQQHNKTLILLHFHNITKCNDNVNLHEAVSAQLTMTKK